MKQLLNKILPYIIAIAVFSIVSLAYFSPVLQGKKLFQNDIKQFTGMAKEINDFRAENHTEPYWTNAAFSGMPTFNLSALYPNDYIKIIDQSLRFLPHPADYLFLYFFGFFILLMVLKVDYKLALLGAVAFGFSTYYIIILGVGHNAKAHAIAFMPLVIAGVITVFRSNLLWGFILTALAMSLEINASHPQMTYYLLFVVLIIGIVYLIDAFKEKQLPNYLKKVFVLLVAVVLAVGTNATSLLATKQYAKFSTRGKSELTINPDGSPKKQSNGLSKDYITQYSYGIAETFNLFIPRFMGGGNAENIGQDSNTYNFLKDKVNPIQANQFIKYAPMYWGTQPIVEAPAYIGSILIFLFVLGIFLLKGNLKKWLVGAVIFSIVLSWGKNFEVLTDFFINYVPLYNKFRAVSSIQVITELAIPLMGILALNEFIFGTSTSVEKLKALRNTFFITGGIALLFALTGSSLFAFESANDAMYNRMLKGLSEAIIADRKELLFHDSVRTFVLVFLAAFTLWMLLKKWLSKNVVILILVVLIVFDLVSIDKNYVNNDSFESAKQIDKPFVATAIDKEILKDKSIYRVANFLVNPMNDGSTSYFHKSIGGYFAAKLGRYQELFDYQIAKNNMQVLDMLNTKYFIFSDKNQKESVQLNPNANGNAWMVQQIKLVNTATEEMESLDSLNTKITAVLNKKFIENNFQTNYPKDSTALIQLTKYTSNDLNYNFHASSTQFVVFSEIYYKDGWNAYIDGKLSPYYQVDYVLRGMQIPAGKHNIEFKFEPTVIKTGSIITLSSYILLFLIGGGWLFISRKRKNVQ